MLTAIRDIHEEVRHRYGSPRMTAELRARGLACSRNTVADIMRRNGIRGRTPRRRARTTDSGHGLPAAPNVLDRKFSAARPDEVWLQDITYLPTGEGWLYLAVILDIVSRMVVGWSMSDAIDSRLVVDALNMSLARRRPGAGLIEHCRPRKPIRERPSSQDHWRVSADAGVTCSMSRKAQCRDNAPVESFSGRMKCELEMDHFVDRDQARAAVFEYLESFHNRVRRHSALGHVSPAEFERTHRPARA